MEWKKVPKNKKKKGNHILITMYTDFKQFYDSIPNCFFQRGDHDTSFTPDQMDFIKSEYFRIFIAKSKLDLLKSANENLERPITSEECTKIVKIITGSFMFTASIIIHMYRNCHENKLPDSETPDLIKCWAYKLCVKYMGTDLNAGDIDIINDACNRQYQYMQTLNTK